MKNQSPTIYLAADHAAFELKNELNKFLVDLGFQVIDKGALKKNPNDDYPDFIIPAAEAVAAEPKKSVAIVLGGSGIGECIAANKVRGVRAALVYDVYTARLSREHNDANVLCLGARTASGKPRLAKQLIKLWLTTKFSAEARHKRRLKKIHDYETRSCN